MGKGEVNPNLGLICKPLPRGGPQIIMVKSKPGVYMDVNGDVVPDEMAEAAGFDVEGGRKIQLMDAEKAEAMADIEAKFAADVKAIDKRIDAADGPPGPPAESDKAGILVKTSQNEPRAVRLVDGGPVRVMEYEQGDGWKIFDRDSGEMFGQGLEKADASELLVAAP